jgi:hypothetical protein
METSNIEDTNDYQLLDNEPDEPLFEDDAAESENSAEDAFRESVRFADEWALTRTLLGTLSEAKIPAVIEDLIEIVIKRGVPIHYQNVQVNHQIQTCAAFRLGQFLFITSDINPYERHLCDSQLRLMDEITDVKAQKMTNLLTTSLGSSTRDHDFASLNLMSKFESMQKELVQLRLHNADDKYVVRGIVNQGSFYGRAICPNVCVRQSSITTPPTGMHCDLTGESALTTSAFCNIFILLPTNIQQQLIKKRLVSCTLVENSMPEEAYIMFENNACVITYPNHIRMYCKSRFHGSAQINLPMAPSESVIDVLECTLRSGELPKGLLFNLSNSEIGQFASILEYLGVNLLHNLQ